MIRNQRLIVRELPESPIRKNFELIQDVLSTDGVLKFEWRFITFSVDVAVTNYLIPHTLPFIPLDILPTQTVGTITFNYPQFTDKFLNITTSGAASFRGLVGRYRENQE